MGTHGSTELWITNRCLYGAPSQDLAVNLMTRKASQMKSINTVPDVTILWIQRARRQSSNDQSR